MAVRGDIRNVAIVAHVDHGKTTLVNAMLAQSHVFNEREEVPDRVMDSNDLEREKGITILAKNTAVQYTGPLAAKYGHPEGITLHIIDTPGHADFGGEVERGISMVDGVVLLVDASEGPLPQTRFVLRKALEAKLPVILCVNKTDRPDARIEEVVGESSDLLLGLAQDVIEEGIDLDEDALFDLPVIYCAAKAGYASENQPENGGLPDNEDLEPLFEAIIKNIPAPEYEEGAPLQAHVANIDSSDFLGRLGLVRIYNGTLEKGKTYGLSRVDGSVENFRVSELLRTQGLERTPVDSAGPGDIVAVAGVNDIMIGETIVDPSDPRPLPLIHVDDPAISMTFGINDSPLAGTEGKDHKLTARMIKDRLDRELIGNVSIKVLPTERPDAWEVQGRGELALAVLAEQMRREGYELTVGRPQVVTKTIDGVKLLDKVSFIVNKNDKIAFVGENELAQTTLFKILMGELEPDEGSIKWGQTVTTSYLPKDNTAYFEGCSDSLVDWIRQYSAKKDDVYLRGFLGRMLFSGEEVFKPVNVLSGGEKVRCMLSRMMLSGANVLLLDQPTNHLDMEAIQAVNKGLCAFPGNILLASHDHELLQTTCNRVIEFQPDGTIIDRLCSYDDYVAWKLAKEAH